MDELSFFAPVCVKPAIVFSLLEVCATPYGSCTNGRRSAAAQHSGVRSEVPTPL